MGQKVKSEIFRVFWIVSWENFDSVGKKGMRIRSKFNILVSNYYSIMSYKYTMKEKPF